MLGAAICFSVSILLIDFTLGGNSPFIFNAVASIFSVAGVGVWLILRHPELVKSKAFWACLGEMALPWRGGHINRKYAWSLVGLAFGGVAFVFALWATQWVDTAVVAIIQNAYPLVYIATVGGTFRKSGRFHRVSLGEWLMSSLAFGGVALVVLGSSTVNSSVGPLVGVLVGVGLALLTAVGGTASSALSFWWGTHLRQKLTWRGALLAGRRDPEELACVLVAFMVSQLLGIPVSLAIGWSNTGIDMTALVGSAVMGLLLVAPGSWCFRNAIVFTDRLPVVLLGYTQSVMAVAWLALLTDITVRRLDYVLTGGAVMVLSGIVLRLLARKRITASRGSRGAVP